MKIRTLTSAVFASIVLVGAVALPANAATNTTLTPSPAPAVTGSLDLATYAGTLDIATPNGEVIVTVKAGEGPAVTAQVRQNASNGVPLARGVEAQQAAVTAIAAATCGSRLNEVAGVGYYAKSVQGCAVIGYPGYQREYDWFNTSDVGICALGNGYNASGTQGWYGIGCIDSGKSYYYYYYYYSVPWGNTLAYTQVEAMSMSGVTGASYQWIA